MADSDVFKGMSAAQIASKINKSGLASDSKEYVKDIASGPNAKEDIIAYAIDNDLFTLFGGKYSKGGMSTKKSRGASDYRKGGMVLSSVDNRKKK